jgi:hypothetical protein
VRLDLVEIRQDLGDRRCAGRGGAHSVTPYFWSCPKILMRPTSLSRS